MPCDVLLPPLELETGFSQMLQRPRKFFHGFGYCAALVFAGVGPALALDPTGDWRVEDGAANIRVAECNGAMWGVVVWEKDTGGIDENNPDKTKATRPTLGMAVLHEMKKKAGADQWAGKVYNPENGKFYTSTIKISDPDKLEIQGCVMGFLCGGETWTRIAPTIPSSPSNNAAKLPQSGQPKIAQPANQPKMAAAAPAATPAKAAAPKKGAAAAQQPPADSVGDICLLPEIARLPH